MSSFTWTGFMFACMPLLVTIFELVDTVQRTDRHNKSIVFITLLFMFSGFSGLLLVTYQKFVIGGVWLLVMITCGCIMYLVKADRKQHDEPPRDRDSLDRAA